MSWVRTFYSATGTWWGAAESDIRTRDRDRVAAVEAVCGTQSRVVLELGCGYGSTAAALVATGHRVVGVDLSERIHIGSQFLPCRGLGLVKADFYSVELKRRFEVVCYWDGFGVGRDDDQRALLERVSREWLTADGVALVDVFNPSTWAAAHGWSERRPARPADGYQFSLGHAREYDPAGGRAIDIWWDESRPEERISQSLRCYSPAEFQELIAPTGLRLRSIIVDGHAHDPHDGDAVDEALVGEWSYLAVLDRR